MHTKRSVQTRQQTPRAADPCVMVIFGGTGDLTKRKLIPALCNLAQAKLLSKQFAVVGFALADSTTETFRRYLKEGVDELAATRLNRNVWQWLSQRLYYVRGDFQNKGAFQELKGAIAKAAKTHRASDNRLFYLAVAPRFIGTIEEFSCRTNAFRGGFRLWRPVK